MYHPKLLEMGSLFKKYISQCFIIDKKITKKSAFLYDGVQKLF